MNAHTANLLNALVLIAMGLWGYLGSETPSPTALIPVGIGVALGLMTPGVKSENKVIAHIAVLLTLLALISLAAKPLISNINAGDTMGIIRVGLMCLTCVIAMVAFIQSFRAARKARG